MNGFILLIFCSAVFFVGCTGISVNVSPHYGSKNKIKNTLNAKVEYAGNPIYFPANVVKSEDKEKLFKYEYMVEYKNGNTNWDGLNLFNPLVLVGFQMSEEGVIVNSKANLIENGVEIKSFTATCVANKPRSMFQNGGSSDARQACLLASKESIENQISDYLGDRK